MMAEKATQIYKPHFMGSDEKPSKEQCLQFLNSSFTEVLQGDDTFKLELKTDEQNNCQLVYRENDIAKDKTFEYKFNMNDINIQKIEYDTKGLEVFIHFETKGGKKFIEILEQGTEKGYNSKMDMKAPDIEKARLIIEAFTNLAEYCSEN
jgi:hypothetical protein